VLRAVLFDWGDTLMQWAWDESLVEAGHRAGLEAIGRDGLPQVDALAARFREAYLPFFWLPGTVEELEYPALVRELLAHFGVEVTDAELDAFLEAEHAAWDPARRLGPATHELLEELRDRGLRLGLVSNAFDSVELLHRDLAQMGIAERLDVAVFSSEFGVRKPHPSIFEHALGRLGVEPREALFVGDDRVTDVGGAAGVGMRTVQALWFRSDERPDAPEPDYRAATPHDVLEVARSLARA
jgi:putative hydrolase of the HAD superfamily